MRVYRSQSSGIQASKCRSSAGRVFKLTLLLSFIDNDMCSLQLRIDHAGPKFVVFLVAHAPDTAPAMTANPRTATIVAPVDVHSLQAIRYACSWIPFDMASSKDALDLAVAPRWCHTANTPRYLGNPLPPVGAQTHKAPNRWLAESHMSSSWQMCTSRLITTSAIASIAPRYVCPPSASGKLHARSSRQRPVTPVQMESQSWHNRRMERRPLDAVSGLQPPKPCKSW